MELCLLGMSVLLFIYLFISVLETEVSEEQLHLIGL